MTIGEKIRFYRTRLGITQAQLASISGLNLSTIKKLETDLMNPKPNLLLKVANALGVSINIFTDFDITTVSDVLSLITKMDEKVDMRFDAEYDSDGNPIPKSIRISFENYSINKKLASYIKQKELQITNDKKREKYSSPEDVAVLNRIDSSLEQVRLELCRDPMIVSKDTTEMAIKLESK